MSFKVNPLPLMIFFSDYVHSGYSTRDQLVKWCYFKELQYYMENKNEGNENKIILGDFKL